jgi:hypothetical protein
MFASLPKSIHKGALYKLYSLPKAKPNRPNPSVHTHLAATPLLPKKPHKITHSLSHPTTHQFHQSRSQYSSSHSTASSKQPSQQLPPNPAKPAPNSQPFTIFHTIHAVLLSTYSYLIKKWNPPTNKVELAAAQYQKLRGQHDDICRSLYNKWIQISLSNHPTPLRMHTDSHIIREHETHHVGNPTTRSTQLFRYYLSQNNNNGHLVSYLQSKSRNSSNRKLHQIYFEKESLSFWHRFLPTQLKMNHILAQLRPIDLFGHSSARKTLNEYNFNASMTHIIDHGKSLTSNNLPKNLFILLLLGSATWYFSHSDTRTLFNTVNNYLLRLALTITYYLNRHHLQSLRNTAKDHTVASLYFNPNPSLRLYRFAPEKLAEADLDDLTLWLTISTTKIYESITDLEELINYLEKKVHNSQDLIKFAFTKRREELEHMTQTLDKSMAIETLSVRSSRELPILSYISNWYADIYAKVAITFPSTHSLLPSPKQLSTLASTDVPSPKTPTTLSEGDLTSRNYQLFYDSTCVSTYEIQRLKDVLHLYRNILNQLQHYTNLTANITHSISSPIIEEARKTTRNDSNDPFFLTVDQIEHLEFQRFEILSQFAVSLETQHRLEEMYLLLKAKRGKIESFYTQQNINDILKSIHHQTLQAQEQDHQKKTFNQPSKEFASLDNDQSELSFPQKPFGESKPIDSLQFTPPSYLSQLPTFIAFHSPPSLFGFPLAAGQHITLLDSQAVRVDPTFENIHNLGKLAWSFEASVRNRIKEFNPYIESLFDHLYQEMFQVNVQTQSIPDSSYEHQLFEVSPQLFTTRPDVTLEAESLENHEPSQGWSFPSIFSPLPLEPKSITATDNSVLPEQMFVIKQRQHQFRLLTPAIYLKQKHHLSRTPFKWKFIAPQKSSQITL